MKLTRSQIQKILDALKELTHIIQSTIIDKKIEKIAEIILQWYKNPIEEKYQQFEDDLVNAILECNEQVYALTSEEIKKIYKIPISLPLSKIVTFEKDGKTLRDRIRRWFCPKQITLNDEEIYWIIEQDNPDYLENKISAIGKITQIVENEANYQKQTVMYDKLHELCDFVILPGGECDEGCPEGIFPIDEFSDYPPYHTNCTCIPIYDITDEWDEIEELGLEDDARGE